MSENNTTAVQANNDIYTGASSYNTFTYLTRNIVNDVATAIPVKVVGVQAGTGSVGYVDVLPLVTFISGANKAVQPVNLYHLPYCRIQGGNAAIIVDPVIGDKGLAVFAQADCSTVNADTTEPQQPGSKRTHSQSDGFYVGGFLNHAPSCFIELTQGNTIAITASSGVTINGNVTVNGDVKANNID